MQQPPSSLNNTWHKKAMMPACQNFHHHLKLYSSFKRSDGCMSNTTHPLVTRFDAILASMERPQNRKEFFLDALAEYFWVSLSITEWFNDSLDPVHHQGLQACFLFEECHEMLCVANTRNRNVCNFWWFFDTLPSQSLRH